MKLAVANSQTGNAESIEVSESTFAREFNESLVHQVVVAQMSGQRQGTKKQKTRSEVSGGGAKPWRQKGTGRARAGTTRSPIWRTGGRTFAAVPRDHSQKVNRKMYQGAMRAILSELIRQERLIVVDEFKIEKPKTKELITKLDSMGLNDVLIVSHESNEDLYLASRNIPKVSVNQVEQVDPVKLLKFERVVMTVDAVRKFEEALS